MASQKQFIAEDLHDTAVSNPGVASFTAHKQREHLSKAFESWTDSRDQTVPVRPTEVPSVAPDAAEEGDANNAWRRAITLLRNRKRTVIKSLVAVALAAAFGWMPMQRLFATASTEAVVNARTIAIRAPITGQVASLVELKVGSTVQSGAPILSIENPRADTSNVNNLRRAAAQIETQIAALKSKQSVLLNVKDKLKTQAERYRLGRAQTVASQIFALDSQIVAANAQYEHATAMLARARALLPKGGVSQASLEQTQRDYDVTRETLNGLRERRKGLEVERTAAEQGTYLTEGYSDSSQSAQRSLDVELELADVEARIEGSDNERRMIQTELQKEEARLVQLSNATIRASAAGRIWEIAVSPGEYVNSGDVLMRVLDCTSASVSATVDESTYQKLRIGQQATFRPRDGGPDLKGSVEELTGLARVGRSNAIESGLLSRADYHLTLTVPELATRTDCMVSRSGLVIFQ